MHEAQRRQLVVGSAVAVTVGIVLYHVFFRKANSISLADAKDRSESKQEEPVESVQTAKAPAEEPVISEEKEEEVVIATTVETLHIEVSEKPGTTSAEESLHESASEEDEEAISVADGESTDATEEELVKDIEANQVDEAVRHISEQIDQAAETVVATVGTTEVVFENESTLKTEEEPSLSDGLETINTATTITTTEVREPVVPKSPWQDLPAVNETNVWESPEWSQQQQQSKTVRQSDLNINSEPFVPKQKTKRSESPEERREMMIKQRQNNASFKARCRYWPKCTNKKCKYVHPMHPCRNDPYCKFGERCIYYHAKDLDASINTSP